MPWHPRTRSSTNLWNGRGSERVFRRFASAPGCRHSKIMGSTTAASKEPRSGHRSMPRRSSARTGGCSGTRTTSTQPMVCNPRRNRIRTSSPAWILAVFAAGLLLSAALPLRSVAEETASDVAVRFQPIADIVREETAAGRIPGAVVVVGQHGQVVYRQAFGNRALKPAVQPMTVDTIFDLASLTKVIATDRKRTRLNS